MEDVFTAGDWGSNRAEDYMAQKFLRRCDPAGVR